MVSMVEIIAPTQLSFPLIGAHPRYIVHKHKASRLHYDLRLEFGASLFNLVLPKGPSIDPRVRRLAIRTHDHKKSCLTFEGRIPSGRYGAGPLLAWDHGRYALRRPAQVSHEEAFTQGLTGGSIELIFDGAKLKGGWTLKRFDENWLFIKNPDCFASKVEILELDKSVFSGRRVDDL